MMTIDPKATVYARNEIRIDADIGAVWGLMAGIAVKKCPAEVCEGVVFQ